ncbi:PIN domain-containing protein [Mesorhizobium sp. YR577]|uniref:PIN domain-containing protein n=1 Tax=Mesorhizobium sp. YR577 TaxID=1884373 RepID=UPI0008EEF6B0|nr:PIN domain-containing protein [Mesorhizobium sp. YR577]SFU19984.1 Predicted nucleic acid-binding protein, contains PIN domain [Mesorhizobium sp. YR577]
MPAARTFIDSTTFLYSIQLREIEERERARNWLVSLTRADAGVTNLQALNEVTSVLTRKAGKFDHADPFDQVDSFADFGSTAIGLATVVEARRICQRYHFSWWDCLLLASALELGCKYFLSEDLKDGQVIEGLTIIDPFAHSPEQILVSR